MLNSLLTAFAKVTNTLFVSSKLLPENPVTNLNIDPKVPTFYISRLNSRSDMIALRKVCYEIGLPDPIAKEVIGANQLPRYIPINERAPLFGHRAEVSPALARGEALFKAMAESKTTQIQVIPVTILWGRNPGKEKAGIGTLLSSSLTPSWLRKFFVLLFSGRDNLIRFSAPVDLEQLKSRHQHGDLSHKLIRVARVHFKRQKLAATGPKLPTRDQLFQGLLASPSVKKAIIDEAKQKNISKQEAHQNAVKLLDEIAADYRESMIRVGERVLTWFWNKLYNGIEVNNAEKVHELTQKGHEIIYMPCHRSHMDYLLLTYVIYHQGLVPPHIAAGINLNFWPAGPIFRRSGAFFIRRTFKGNKLYSTIFREYLSQLFIKGYSVKFYAEGGRSRTGRLLSPKTGMLGMTLQTMLRGIERPISIVPVYIGYEHVMEVNTYLKELAGSNKQNESILGVFKTLKKLKNYGKGNVNFGEPININQFLNQTQPNWREDINSDGVQKPSWLNPCVSQLANEVMVNINQSAALNSVTLMSLTLLVTDKLAMPKNELISQLNFLLSIATNAPYSEQVTLPQQSPEQLINHALSLNKFEAINDSFGDIVQVVDKEKVLLNYYRNNVIHLFALPSLIALIAIKQRQTPRHQLLQIIELIYPLFEQEWHMNPLDHNYANRILDHYIDLGLLTEDDGSIQLNLTSGLIYNIEIISRLIECTLMRFSSVITLICDNQGMKRNELESMSHEIANRLGKLHGIVTPEFFDKKVLTHLINALRDNDHIELSETNMLIGRSSLLQLKDTIGNLLDVDIKQSIEKAILQQN